MRAAHITICILALSVPCALLAGPTPSIDGFLSEPFWATQARSWTLHDPAQPDDFARCYIGYDDQFLFFAADVWDGNVVGINRAQKSKAWEDDAIKLMLHLGDPNATRWTDTWSFTFSAMGGATWCRGPLPANIDPNTEPGWPPSGSTSMLWAVGLKAGTNPNITGTRDMGYVVEARIPWIELGFRPPFKSGSTLGLCLVNMNRPEMALPGGRPLSSVAAARQIHPTNPSLWERVRMDWQGPLSTRGLVEPLPLWLGSASLEFEAFKTAETDSRGPWLDRSQWTTRLANMRGQNLNTLLLRHTDPLRGLLSSAPAGQVPDTRPAQSAPAEMGRSGWFSADTFARHQDQFRWILAEARKNGINVYLMLDNQDAWSARVPATQPASQPASDRALAPTQASIRQAIALLVRTYPELTGLAAGEGYNTPAMLEAIAAGLPQRPPAATSSGPAAATQSTSPARSPASLPVDPPSTAAADLLVWTGGVSPEFAARLSSWHPAIQWLHQLEGGQWFKPLVEPDAARFLRAVQAHGSAREASGVSGVVLGSLRGASSYLFWADPQWIRTLLMDVRNQGLDGFLLEVGPGEHSLAREAVADYAYNIGRQYSPQRWESRMRLFGAGDYSAQLLELMQHASAIMPELQLVLHDNSARFMPQFGLLLPHYLHMPSYLVNPEPGDVGDHGRLMPALGIAWPSPVWDRGIAGIQDAVARVAPPDAIAAADIIQNLARHVNAGQSLLPALRHLTPNDPEQAARLSALLDAIEFNMTIGEHTRWKLEAAHAWAQYKARRGRSIDVTQPLGKSVEAWSRVAALADRLYPVPVAYWQSQPVSPPPWSPAYLRSTYVPLRGHWREQLWYLQREYELIMQTISAEGSAADLPLWDLVHAAPGDKRQTRFVLDFDKPDRRYQLRDGASIITDAAQRISGDASMLIDTRQMPAGWHEVFTTDGGLVPLVGLQKYQVLLAYRVIDAGQPDPADPVAEPFEMGFRPINAYAPLGDHKFWTAPNGFTGVRVLQVPPPRQDGNVLYIALRRPAAVIIDQIQIAQIAD